MGDFFVVLLTAGLIFFMFTRGGCCGGHGHGKGDHQKQDGE
jgi:hypothetical protein